MLAPEEARTLIDSIEVTTIAGLRDRALIGMMVLSFARIGGALGMKVEDMIDPSSLVRLKRAALHIVFGKHAFSDRVGRAVEPAFGFRFDGAERTPSSRCGAFYVTRSRRMAMMTRVPISVQANVSRRTRRSR